MYLNPCNSVCEIPAKLASFVFLFCFVLFCFVLFCFVLFCCALFCFVVCLCFVLFCFVLFCFVFFLFCFVFVFLFVCLAGFFFVLFFVEFVCFCFGLLLVCWWFVFYLYFQNYYFKKSLTDIEIYKVCRKGYDDIISDSLYLSVTLVQSIRRSFAMREVASSRPVRTKVFANWTRNKKRNSQLIVT